MPPKTPRKAERPVFWIIAGPNGSGKSSLYNETSIEGWGGSVWIINPDLLTLSIAETEMLARDAANLAAVQRIENWLDASIDVYSTIGVETVLSSAKYRRLLERAQQRGFDVRMIFITLRSADEQLERIRLRVAEGGHDVPEAKVRSRRVRSFAQLAWFAQAVDQLFVFDNSGASPRLLASRSKGAPLLWQRTGSKALYNELVAAGLPAGSRRTGKPGSRRRGGRGKRTPNKPITEAPETEAS